MSDHKAMRAEVLARYRAYRQAIQRNLNAALSFVSGATLKDASRRLGLLSGGTIVAEDFSEMTLAFDLALFGNKPGRSRAIDRYARATSFPEGSVEAITLAALLANTFRLIRVKTRHEIAGFVVEDIVRQQELWLLDEAMDARSDMPYPFAARLIQLDSFHATVGAIAPVHKEMLELALDGYGTRRGKLDEASFDDPRLAEAIYAAAVGSGLMGNVAYAE